MKKSIRGNELEFQLNGYFLRDLNIISEGISVIRRKTAIHGYLCALQATKSFSKLWEMQKIPKTCDWKSRINRSLFLKALKEEKLYYTKSLQEKQFRSILRHDVLGSAKPDTGKMRLFSSKI